MPDYRRKQRGRFSSPPKADKSRIAKKKKVNGIKLDEELQSSSTKKRGLRLLKGNKAEIRRRWQITGIVLAIISAVVLALEFLIPAGLYETAISYTAMLGSGEYPIDFDSSNTDNAVLKSNYYYVLTDNDVKAVTNNGRVIYSYNHGFENPVIKTSQTRALVFDQGGNNALILTLHNNVSVIDSENEIINAAIGDDGTYALVTTADSYVAQVSVYKKNDKLIYEWLSSSDMINNVAVSPSGKKIAISTLKTNVSGFDSSLMILNFKSDGAEFRKEYKGEIIYSLSNVSSRGVSVMTANTFNFIKWSDFKLSEYKNDYNLQMLRESKDGILLLYNRENDKTDNRIVMMSKKGEVKCEFNFNGIITDLAFRNNHIYCISDTKAYIIDNQGKIIRKADCGFGAVRFAVISQNEIAVITDNQINKVKFSQE